MSPFNPLDSLRKASSIGPPKLPTFQEEDVMRGEMFLPLGGALKALKGLIPGLGRNVAPGAANAVESLSKAGSEASSRISPVQETLGEVDPRFTPVGGEDLYNLAKKGVQHPVDAAMAAYHRILERGGR
jgi:hypothetical protein